MIDFGGRIPLLLLAKLTGLDGAARPGAIGRARMTARCQRPQVQPSAATDRSRCRGATHS